MIALLAALLLALGSALLFALVRDRLMEREWQTLELLATDEVERFALWRRERADEARFFVQGRLHRGTLLELLSFGSVRDAEHRRAFLTDLDAVLARGTYDAVLLIDRQLRVRFERRSPGGVRLPDRLSSEVIPPAGEVALLDLPLASAAQGGVGLLMTAAVGAGAEPPGALLFVMRREHELLAFPNHPAAPGSSLESLVVRPLKEAGTLHITPPRFEPGRLRSEERLTGVAQQLQGRTGRVEGRDYRGVSVVAVGRPLPGSPWQLITKVDRAEVTALPRRVALWTTLLAGGLLAMVGWSLETRRRADQVRFDLAVFRAGRDRERLERELLARRFDNLARFANDAILLSDGAGRIIDANERAGRSYGVPRERLIGQSIEQLQSEQERPQFHEKWQALLTRGELVYESEHRRADGGRFPVECSGRRFDLEGQLRVQVIIRDISERRRRELGLRRLKAIYELLGRTNEAIIRLPDGEGLLARVCEAAVASGYFPAAAVCRVSAGGLVRVAYAGPPAAPVGAAGEGCGGLAEAAGRAIAGGRLVTLQQAPGRWAVLVPIRRRAGIEGVLALCGEWEEEFDLPTQALLAEIGDNLGSAFDYLASRAAEAAATAQLHRSREQLALAIDAAGDAYWDVNLADDELLISSRLRAMLGGTPASSGGLIEGIKGLIAEAELPAVARAYHDHLAGRSPRFTAEFRLRGQEAWGRLRGRVIRRDAAGRPLRVAGTLSDITEQRRQQSELALWGTVFRASRDAIIITDAQRRILSVNPAFTQITGYALEEVRGRDPRLLASGLHERPFYTALWDSIAATGHWQGELRDRRKDGSVVPLWVAISAARDGRGEIQHYVSIASDMSERVAAEREIRHLAYHDALTGLPNRALFRDRLALAVAHARRHRQRLAVLFVDLDRFKWVNDSLGHRYGDELLRQVAVRLGGCMRTQDTVCRQGGDEFILLIWDVAAAEDAARVARKVLAELARPFDLFGHEVPISSSVGIALFPEDGSDGETLVRNADAAMYLAKEQGRNTFKFFVPELNRRARARMALEIGLRRALERGELELHYQPQSCLRSGALVGAEALLRWRRGERLVYPCEFIGFAEESRLIFALGEWVVAEVCRQQRRWQEAGLDTIPLAINLSPVQFRSPPAMEQLTRLIEQASPAPGSIELELTEGGLMEEAEASARRLAKLKESGIRIAIDDFGTGYSSLSYLRRFPIDRVKIDRSFVHGLAASEANRTVTSAIIALVHALHMGVLAEGVETEEEAGLLRAWSCDQQQGFLLAPALPPEEFAAWRQAESASPAVG